MERKLASIKRIDSISAIEGADLIEAVHIGGWTVVAQKAMGYKPNDLVVYCEIDSFIPTEVAPFLTQAGHFPKEYKGIKGERLRTKKLKGVVSQGLLLPLSVVSDNPMFNAEMLEYEGADVSQLLNIQKWEPPQEFQAANAKGNFPCFIPKTDQERIQNITRQYNDWFNTLALFEKTEKLDGSSMTVYMYGDQVGVCSRNLELKEDMNNTFWATAYSSGSVEALKSRYRNLALQGELIGPGIQGNKYNLTEHAYYIYDVFDIDKQKYLLPVERQELVKELGLKHVPVLEGNSLWGNIQQELTDAEGKSVLNNKTEREGIVFKSLDYDHSFKVISNKWLMKYD